MKEAQENVSLSAQLRGMRKGSKLSLPARRLYVVRATAYSIGFTLGRRYSTHIDREKNTVTVTRLK